MKRLIIVLVLFFFIGCGPEASDPPETPCNEANEGASKSLCNSSNINFICTRFIYVNPNGLFLASTPGQYTWVNVGPCNEAFPQ